MGGGGCGWWGVYQSTDADGLKLLWHSVLQYPEAATVSVPWKKAFFKFHKIHWKIPVKESFNKAAGWSPTVNCF